MKKMVLVMASLAAVLLVGEAGGASAQMMKKKVTVRSDYNKKGSAKYRPLTVAAKPTGVADDAVGVAGGVLSGTVAGAGTLIAAPFAGLTGGSVGISPVAAPPLPIQARYARSGKVFASYDQGYSQDVPVDNSGPIYKIDDKATRTVTPFSLAAFPITAAASAITAPLRPAAQP